LQGVRIGRAKEIIVGIVRGVVDMALKYLGSSSPFEFISEDVGVQLKVSRDVAGEAEKIHSLVLELQDTGADPSLLNNLISLRDRLISSAQELANNATETSSSAAVIISDVTSTSST
jgi:hypothetical protein